MDKLCVLSEGENKEIMAISYTVECPNKKDTLRKSHFVPCRELALSLKVSTLENNGVGLQRASFINRLFLLHVRPFSKVSLF